MACLSHRKRTSQDVNCNCTFPVRHSVTYVCTNSQELHRAADILVIDQPDNRCMQQVVWQQMYLPHDKFLLITNLTHFFLYLFISCLHVSSITVLIIRRSNCINTSSCMISLCNWLLGMPVRSSLLTGIPSR
jgi:hypothetical protein